jgi:hypothetical protein
MEKRKLILAAALSVCLLAVCVSCVSTKNEDLTAGALALQEALGGAGAVDGGTLTLSADAAANGDVAIPAGVTLLMQNGSSLTVPKGSTLDVSARNAAIELRGGSTLDVGGTLKGNNFTKISSGTIRVYDSTLIATKHAFTVGPNKLLVLAPGTAAEYNLGKNAVAILSGTLTINTMCFLNEVTIASGAEMLIIAGNGPEHGFFYSDNLNREKGSKITFEAGAWLGYLPDVKTAFGAVSQSIGGEKALFTIYDDLNGLKKVYAANSRLTLVWNGTEWVK